MSSEAKESSNESSISLDSEVENGKNKHLVKCQFCPSHILNPGLGTYSKSECKLPLMTKTRSEKGDSEKEKETESEVLTHYWSVSDMYAFENIGFSNTIGDLKYLACADCEVGPIGFYNTESKVSYIALARVCHNH